MKERLIELLESFGYPVRLQGSLAAAQEYPQNFFTYWQNSTFENAHYDNRAVRYTWDFDINFYSVDPETVNRVLLEARELLEDHGFIIDGFGYDVGSDEITHTGMGMRALIMRNEEG